MTYPTAPPSPSSPPLTPAPYPPTSGKPRPTFGRLAWASVILGIVGIVFSAVPILDILTMLAAIVGIALGGVALFGSRKILAAIGTVLCVLAVIFTALVMSSFSTAVGSPPSPLTPPSAGDAAPAPVAPAAPAGPVTSFGEGTYVVGTDIAAGTYRSTGPVSGGLGICYWERDKDTSGEFSSIIANDLGEGPATVTISKTDGAFKTHGCNTWNKVS